MHQEIAAIPDGGVAVVLGTRPEIIKLAGVIAELGPKACVIHTGQHYDTGLSDVFFTERGLPAPRVRFAVGGAGRGGQIGAGLTSLDEWFARHRPVAVVVQGDTNATVTGALAANARRIPVVHVEAGLRSFDKTMPEEYNRIITDHLSDLLCAATEGNVENLAREGIGGAAVIRTGNTVVEAVRAQLPGRHRRRALLARRGLVPGGYALVTVHRPENTDDAAALRTILTELHRLPCPVVLPLHPRTLGAVRRHGLVDLLDGLGVTGPLGSAEFLGLAAHAAFLVSDSGGVQEECTVLKRPLIVVRRSTERPEAMQDFAVLVSPGPLISKTAAEWWRDLPGLHRRLAALESPFGAGDASRRIVAEIARRFGTR
ncbi:UDP-N-acetylglucosamine 2-epimerase (non-hydrolyzing) [Amycolatopsis rhizosphaerae]|uniref:UDP-N-acetylglucosamine 2-epimerase (Non-hydrolyzing) n=1 Tax=Amycolatopsis rhizosphaerae TaxID=2053003 RepID=A0A558ATF2_9PSEU|nr:UDP-N-acetylglucosamine 2-epimerase (non-hydrolyzing) [Amycolatopsis rhizosphaerae]TVT27538.1 UDP-N-acetylglucosamine 2-epimerase (non-hydrolyzing) [Amycolatopsis rhizosphaerae]